MKAIIRRGKRIGEEVEIDQWCNDWFTSSDGSVFGPSSLAFDDKILIEIREKNCGVLLEEYEIVNNINRGEYHYSFKRKK